MNPVALKELFTTGAVGPVRVGSTEGEVVDALGQPQGVSVQRKPKVVKYGPLQLTLARQGGEPARVVALSIDPRGGEPVPHLGTPIPNTRGELTSLLRSLGIEPTTPAGGSDDLVLPSGVRFVFEGEHVHGMYVRGPANAHPASKSKQVSVTLPVETVQALQALAKERKLPGVRELVTSVLEREAKRTADE